MQNLGKLLIASVLIPNAIYAGVVASVDYATVTVGETVTYSLKVVGADIQRPILDTICQSNVVSTSAQTNIEMINGNYTKSKVLSYQFVPRKSCVIEPKSVVVNGDVETTQAIKIVVKPATQDLNADFLIELTTNKKDVYVGEPFELILLLKQKHRARVVDSKFIPPKLKGFWIKEELKPQRYNEGEFGVTKVVYKLSAQREGSLQITPAQVAIATRTSKRDRWGSFLPQVKWKSYFSNELKMSVNAIPNGVTLIGDFSINATVDKKSIDANEAVNVTIVVAGSGNLEDIGTFKPSINGVSVFDEKPQVNATVFRQKIALVGDNNFLVPAFKVKYFSLKSRTVKEISSKEIQITVKDAK